MDCPPRYRVQCWLSHQYTKSPADHTSQTSTPASRFWPLMLKSLSTRFWIPSPLTPGTLKRRRLRLTQQDPGWSLRTPSGWNVEKSKDQSSVSQRCHHEVQHLSCHSRTNNTNSMLTYSLTLCFSCWYVSAIQWGTLYPTPSCHMWS